MADIEQNENSNQAANTMEETDLVTPVEARLATLDKETVSTNDNVKNDKQELLEDKEDKQGGTHSSPVENDTDTQKEASAIKTSQTKEEKKSKKDISKVSQSEQTKDKVKPTGLAKKKSRLRMKIPEWMTKMIGIHPKKIQILPLSSVKKIVNLAQVWMTLLAPKMMCRMLARHCCLHQM